MPQWTKPSAGWRRPVLAGLMAGLLFLLGLLAANERFHAQLHADSTAPHGACSFCALAKGQLDAPSTVCSFRVVSAEVVWNVPAFDPAHFQAVDLSVASSRGPPASVSIL